MGVGTSGYLYWIPNCLHHIGLTLGAHPQMLPSEIGQLNSCLISRLRGWFSEIWTYLLTHLLYYDSPWRNFSSRVR